MVGFVNMTRIGPAMDSRQNTHPEPQSRNYSRTIPHDGAASHQSLVSRPSEPWLNTSQRQPISHGNMPAHHDGSNGTTRLVDGAGIESQNASPTFGKRRVQIPQYVQTTRKFEEPRSPSHHPRAKARQNARIMDVHNDADRGGSEQQEARQVSFAPQASRREKDTRPAPTTATIPTLLRTENGMRDGDHEVGKVIRARKM
jgi:hypothetical protein